MASIDKATGAVEHDLKGKFSAEDKRFMESGCEIMKDRLQRRVNAEMNPAVKELFAEDIRKIDNVIYRIQQYL